MIEEKLYKQIVENTVISCVDVCLLYNGKVFLAKRKEEPAKNQWFVPGGRIWLGESIEKSAKRKIKEELGIDIITLGQVLTGMTTFKKKGKIRQTLNVVILAKPTDAVFKIKLNKTLSEYKWVNKTNTKYHPYVNNCINKVLQNDCSNS